MGSFQLKLGTDNPKYLVDFLCKCCGKLCNALGFGIRVWLLTKSIQIVFIMKSGNCGLYSWYRLLLCCYTHLLPFSGPPDPKFFSSVWPSIYQFDLNYSVTTKCGLSCPLLLLSNLTNHLKASPMKSLKFLMIVLSQKNSVSAVLTLYL